MKKLVAILLAAVLMLSLAACNTDNLAEYKKAVEKTDQIKKGQMAVEFAVELDLDTKDMTAEEIKNLNYVKDMSGSFNAVYDDEQNKGIYRNYLNLGGLGFDFDVYLNGDEIYAKLPVVGKYLRLNDIKSVDLNEFNYEQNIITEESQKALIDKWVSLMKKEDVFKGKDIILTTQDGEVKTTEYTITLSDEQIKTLALEAFEIAYKDESLKQFYKENIIRNTEKTYEEFIEQIKINLDDYAVENFKYTALVDIDNYIVSENITFSINSTNDELLLKKASYYVDIKNWSINKTQSFSFPELTEENTMKTDNLDEMPDLMKDILNNKK